MNIKSYPGLARKYIEGSYYGVHISNRKVGHWATYNKAMSLLLKKDAEIARLQAEVERLREALEPSGDTKAAYMGEITDPDTKRIVSWTAIKMVMEMISDRALRKEAP